MAGICCYARTSPTIYSTIRCCSGTPNNKKETPHILKMAVSGVTEVLRIFSSFGNNKVDNVSCYKDRDEEVSLSGIDDVIKILKSDYENAYFVTGVFTSEIYAEDCIFEDPTIKFSVFLTSLFCRCSLHFGYPGKELYERNLKLLVPFFEGPSIGLQKIEKVLLSKNYLLLTVYSDVGSSFRHKLRNLIFVFV